VVGGIHASSSHRLKRKTMDSVLRNILRRETQAAAIVELVGTFFLTLAALLGGHPYVAGLTLGVWVYGYGNLSGSHLNPAVTLGLAFGRRIGWDGAVIYIVAQIVGALLAAVVGGLVGDLAADYQAAGIWAEFIGFGLLMLTVLALSDGYVPQAGSGIAIGGALTAGLAFSGGILNPAVAIALGETISAATWAPLLSAVACAALFGVLKPARPA
jgi:aquaporin Z